nr:MAG TPA: hypothetical protein [Caudoviricetes sp.]
MTLDEAIAKAKKALERQNLSERGRENFSQFAAWLEELKHYREKKIQETNLDHFKHEILEEGIWDLAVVKGEPKHCKNINCSDCEFYKDKSKDCFKDSMDWLKQPYIKPAYKLTQFENDLLKSYSKGFLNGHEFKSIPVLSRMKEKGYFKGVDKDATIEDILADCEVTEED